jgi:hypothetical protein
MGEDLKLSIADPAFFLAAYLAWARQSQVLGICKTLRVSRATLYRYVGMKSSGVESESRVVRA